VRPSKLPTSHELSLPRPHDTLPSLRSPPRPPCEVGASIQLKPQVACRAVAKSLLRCDMVRRVCIACSSTTLMQWSHLHWYGRSSLNGCVGSRPASPALMVDGSEHPEHLRTSEGSGEDDDDSGAARIHGRGWALHSRNFLVQRSATALKAVPLAPALLTLRQLQH